MSLLHDVHALLAEAGVSHALIGASALLYHGHDRTTADSDLLVVAWAPLQRSFWTLGSEVSIEIRRGDDEDPLAGVVVLVTDDEIVDVVVGRGRWQRELIERADTSGSVPVATLPDLVLLKLHAGGVRDRDDIKAVLPLMSAEQIASVESRLHVLSQWSQDHWKELRP